MEQKTFGGFFRKFRQERGFTQAQVGIQSRLGRTYINKIESDTVADIRVSTLIKLARGVVSEPVDLFTSYLNYCRED